MSTHGPNIEFHRANRVGGPMSWRVAELANIGPIVRIRPIREDGTRGPWETMAIALDPARYIDVTRGDSDVVLGGVR